MSELGQNCDILAQLGHVRFTPIPELTTASLMGGSISLKRLSGERYRIPLDKCPIRTPGALGSGGCRGMPGQTGSLS
jgi:hypothetical protein